LNRASWLVAANKTVPDPGASGKAATGCAHGKSAGWRGKSGIVNEIVIAQRSNTAIGEGK